IRENPCARKNSMMGYSPSTPQNPSELSSMTAPSSFKNETDFFAQIRRSSPSTTTTSNFDPLSLLSTSEASVSLNNNRTFSGTTGTRVLYHDSSSSNETTVFTCSAHHSVD